MNDNRRKEIRSLYPACEKLNELAASARIALNAFRESAEELKGEIESIRDSEQEYLDNLPENLKQSAKAQLAESAVEALDSAIEMVDEESDLEDFDSDDLIGKLDEATASAE